jgi:hypothetical protein
MWGIWCLDTNDWAREMPSNVNDGGVAVLAFFSKQAACKRAAERYFYDTYTEAKRDGWCEVRKITK